MAVSISIEQSKSIVDIVSKVLEKNYPLDKTLNFHFRDNHISDEYDRAAIAEISYELIRWWRLLLEINNSWPVSGQVNYFNLLGTWLVLNNWQVPSSIHFKTVNKEFIKNEFQQLSNIRKIRQSVPDWFDQAGYAAFGADWEQELEALNKMPPICLRTNRLKIKPVDLAQKLKAEGFETSFADKAPDALILKERANIFSSKYYKDGYFEVQDAGSQLIAPYLDAKPGMRVADVCAGNGGKTLHLASLMQNKGKIIAMDTKEEKLKTLKSRLTRAGAEIIETRLLESSKTSKRLADSFDRLLLDVPCSGTGALRRNPEIKWRITSEQIKKLQKIQADLLRNYSIMLKSGGTMVYSTCSILPSENHEQIQLFLKQNPTSFELTKEQFVSPSKTGFDGFYMAQLRKK
jgi:16S rRNA (cytosine967-C5)-methyltransferase